MPFMLFYNGMLKDPRVQYFPQYSFSAHSNKPRQLFQKVFDILLCLRVLIQMTFFQTGEGYLLTKSMEIENLKESIKLRIDLTSICF